MKTSKFSIRSIVLISYFLSGLVLAQSNESFLLPPEVITLPEKADNYSKENRKFTGIPSVAISNGGKIWSVWYSGITGKEDKNNYVVVSSSTDDGNNWKEELIIDPDGDGQTRAFDPEIWFDPTGKLWVFWAQSIGHDGTVAGVWALTSVNTEAGTPKWTVPKRLTDGIMMCKPTVLSNGDWVLPISTWRLTDNSAKVIVSIDNGQSWHERGAVNVPKDNRSFDEHMIIEKKDGTLWMLVRTTYGIGESISKDQGRSWGKLNPSKIKHPSARFFIRRLKSGNLLLVKHGPIDIKIRRSHLMAFISKDDGKTWSRGLLIDQREGVSYPDGQETRDGKIHIVYDYNRISNQNIFITNFTESDILENDYDKRIIKVSNNRKIVSEGGID